MPAALGPTFRLVYRSHTRIAPDDREDELRAIFGIASAKNAGLGVTGALLAWQDAFVQVLEGEKAVVQDLYGTIKADPRHAPVVVLDADTVPQRVFGDWSMARVGDSDGVDIPVRMDAQATESAALHSGDPNQDTMLDLMREYARLDIAS